MKRTVASLLEEQMGSEASQHGLSVRVTESTFSPLYRVDRGCGCHPGEQTFTRSLPCFVNLCRAVSHLGISEPPPNKMGAKSSLNFVELLQTLKVKSQPFSVFDLR